MIKLTAFMPDPADPTAYYRGWGPLSMLRRQIPLQWDYGVEVNMRRALDTDIAFVQRPANQENLLCVAMLKEFGTPLWIDYDDDYINVSESNPRKGTGLDVRVTESVIKCLGMADVVTVTNSHLKKVYSEFCDAEKIVVVPNAQDDRLLSLQRPEEKIGAQNVVLWRGNILQKRDITHFRREILQVYRNSDTSNVHWMFAGEDPSWITDEMKEHDPKRVQKFHNQELLEFYRWLTSVNWAVIIKPLEDTVFNHSRSNITWQEACFAGSACLAPNWDSWTEFSPLDSLVTYESPEDFKKHLTRLLKNGDEIRARVIAGRKYIKENLLLSTVNQKRVSIINKLLEDSHANKQVPISEAGKSKGSDPKRNGSRRRPAAGISLADPDPRAN